MSAKEISEKNPKKKDKKKKKKLESKALENHLQKSKTTRNDKKKKKKAVEVVAQSEAILVGSIEEKKNEDKKPKKKEKAAQEAVEVEAPIVEPEEAATENAELPIELEELSTEPETPTVEEVSTDKPKQKKKKKKKKAEEKRKKLSTKFYEKELARLQTELVKLQEWIKENNLKVVVIFEGRDAAGKGGVIKRITESLNPRICRVVALGTPTERETTQWYFQRYVSHLPASGEMVLFDRSWYNRAGVERVMGFCTMEQVREFFRSCPEFERMLVRSGIILIKYWFSVSDEEQEKRFQARIDAPTKRWKLSPMDLESRAKWIEYSKAKDEMFAYTDIKQAPWYVVNADDKKRARLNCISHLLSMIPYEDLTPAPLKLPPRQDDVAYMRPPITDQTFVPEKY